MAIHNSVFSWDANKLPSQGFSLRGKDPFRRDSVPELTEREKGVFRGFLGAGEAVMFGIDSISVPFIKEAGVILCFYGAGIIIFAYMAAFHIKETEYFSNEEGVVVPKHVLDEYALSTVEDAEKDWESKDVATTVEEQLHKAEKREDGSTANRTKDAGASDKVEEEQEPQVS